MKASATLIELRNKFKDPSVKAMFFTILIVLIISAVTIIGFMQSVNDQKQDSGVTCPDDLKECNDGTKYKRQLPDCGFPPCPEDNV